MLVWFTFWMHMPVWFISTNWRLHCWIPSLSAVLFSSCSRSWYRGTVRTVTSSFPVSQASCRVSFSPCCSYAEVARILLTLISPICAWKSKTSSSQDSFCIKSLIKVTTRVRTRMVFLRALLGDFIFKQATNIYVTLSVTEDNFRRKTLSRDE